MDDTRRHPDLFTAAEALAYLHLPGESDRTLETLRQNGLHAVKIGQCLMYHRAHLDAFLVKLFGLQQAQQVAGKLVDRLGRRSA